MDGISNERICPGPNSFGDLYWEFCHLKRAIMLPLLLEKPSQCRTKTINSVFVKNSSSYNMILYRPSQYAFIILHLFYHWGIKFSLTNVSKCRVLSNRQEAGKCYMMSLRSKSQTMKIELNLNEKVPAEPISSIEEPKRKDKDKMIKLEPGVPIAKILFGLTVLKRKLKIYAVLPAKRKADLNKILYEFKGIFSWSIEDVSGILRDIADTN
ncbi:hypothetical protein ACH5RR_041118 [Cinchona calisaya]|uniref:Uncharacterized protein n=1 Tax=Cinchona calisaya TaxID=153742 RepID=A0ABD2XV89_9GENT